MCFLAVERLPSLEIGKNDFTLSCHADQLRAVWREGCVLAIPGRIELIAQWLPGAHIPGVGKRRRIDVINHPLTPFRKNQRLNLAGPKRNLRELLPGSYAPQERGTVCQHG